MTGKQTGFTKSRYIAAVVANYRGEIFDLEGYAAVGMSGPALRPLVKEDSVPMPFGSELMFLPDRIPVVFNVAEDKFELLSRNPHNPRETILPVSVFNSPGYVLTDTCAFREKEAAAGLPLFSYGAVGWFADGFRSAAICVDREKRQDLRRMNQNKVKAGVKRMRKQLPENRLRAHLEKCALTWGCPAGKNFFLQRYEAPLPTSNVCNARCLGCISLQTDSSLPTCQERIPFTPTPEEIADIALTHIRAVENAVVSFGQGCEGDPLLRANVIETAIHIIREKTQRGTINLNTNGSLPDTMKRLFKAGLDSTRISATSVRPYCYEAYFRPVSYRWEDVVKSIDVALSMNKFVSVNYLNCPGFTDTPEEVNAMIEFLQARPVHMIQWRNLNFDPLRYVSAMNAVHTHGAPIGMKKTLKEIKNASPEIKYGYFNPPKEKFNAPDDFDTPEKTETEKK